MIPKRVPGQFRQQAMVLLRVVAVVSENKVRRPTKGMKPSRNALAMAPGAPLFLQTVRPTGPGGTHSHGTEHHPVEHSVRILAGETQDCAAAADFDIVRVRSQTKDFEGRCRIQRPPQKKALMSHAHGGAIAPIR